MASPFRILPLIFPAALLGSTLWVFSPAQAASEAEGRAIAQCRAELFTQFPEGALRSHRVGEIAGNSRRTRVTLYATADRRYTFECTTDADGQIVTASLNPPASTQLAADRQGAAPRSE